MPKDDDKSKTPTIADIMQTLDRASAEREADNAAARKRQKADNAAARKRQKADNAAARKRQKADNAAAKKRQEEAEKRQEEAEKRQEETEKRLEALAKQAQETERQAQATERQVQATSREVQATGVYVREIGKQVGDVGNQWGKIAEYLVAGDFGRILRERFGITIDHSAPSLSGSYQGKDWEVDVFAANGEIVLVGEVKLTLTMEAIDKFVTGNLGNFHRYMPLYRDKKIYGLLAFIKMHRGEEKQITAYVHRLGLLLVKVIDNTFDVLTPQGHTLKDYNPTRR